MPTQRTARRHHRPSSASDVYSDDHAFIDFRDRLCSVDSHKSRHAPVPEHGEAARSIVDRLRADFALDTGKPSIKRGSTGSKSVKPNNTVVKLTDAFTQSGAAIYAAGIDKLIVAHADIEHQISDFSLTSSNALETNAALYNNISYPLSKTMCSAGDEPSSIATRLAELAKYLDQAEGRLKALKLEWDTCADAEKEAWAQLDRDTPHPETRSDEASTVADTAGLCAEATKIAESKIKMVEEIEKDFKEHMRAITAEMLQNMCQE